MLTIIMTLASSAPAATYHVSKDGSRQFATIQDGVNVAAPGDTVLVYPGRYDDLHPFSLPGWTQDVVVGVETSDLTIAGVSADSVIVGPESLEWGGTSPKGIAVQVGVTGLRVSGIRIESLRDGMYLVGDTTVEGMAFFGCAIGIVSYASSDVTISDTEFGQGPGIADGFISFDSGGNILVENCTFTDNNGIRFIGAGRGTVDSCVFDGGKLGVQWDGADGVVKDSVFRNATKFNVEVISSTDVRLTRNDMGSTLGYNIICWSGGRVLGSHNKIAACGFPTFFFRSNGTARMSNNEILFDVAPVVEVFPEGLQFPMITIDLQNNYWGTSNGGLISASIVDNNDDEEIRSIVEFEPFLPGPPLATHQSSMGAIRSKFGQ